MMNGQTIEYDLSIKSNEALIHAITWMYLENITLSENMLSKPVTKIHVWYDSIYMKCQEEANL
jgi:hypothetical protein